MKDEAKEFTVISPVICDADDVFDNKVALVSI